MTDQLDLARRLVACKHFRWMPGMLPEWSKEQRFKTTNTQEGWVGTLPDLADPATLGCLLALVREAWGRPHIIAVFDHDAPEGFWRIMDGTRYPSIGWGHTEVETLVAALEAAPSPA